MRLNEKLASPQAWRKSKACDGFPDQIYVLDLVASRRVGSEIC